MKICTNKRRKATHLRKGDTVSVRVVYLLKRERHKGGNNVFPFENFAFVYEIFDAD